MPAGLSPALEEALETFAAENKARAKKVDVLTAKAEAGGVKGMATKQELRILEAGRRHGAQQARAHPGRGQAQGAEDVGRRGPGQGPGEQAAVAKKDADARRAAMKARAAMFEGGGGVAPKA